LNDANLATVEAWVSEAGGAVGGVHQAHHDAGPGGDCGQTSVQVCLEQHRVHDVGLLHANLAPERPEGFESADRPDRVDLETLRSQ
jgi:hypothetical protein